jgi:ABC-2 type transport system permease protein
MLGTVLFGSGNINIGPGEGISVSPSSDVNYTEVGALGLIGVYGFLGVVASVIVLVYLLDCLYAERKDRSILFWKSLPVSDAETVLSKLFVAMVLLPVGVMLLALLMQPLLGLIMYLRFEPLRDYLSLSLVAGWPAGMGRLLASWVFGLLWYLPFAAYLMLASVLAKRAPLVYAAMPPLVLLVWEAWMLDSGHIRGFLVERFLFVGQSMQLLLDYNDMPGRGFEAFLAPQLWIGVAVGAGMLYTVIRLRRYRDDT